MVSTPNNFINHRRDFEIIASWVKPDSKILDLGCGDGSLLEIIRKTKQIDPALLQGIEKDWGMSLSTLRRGFSVLNGTINHNLNLITEDSFDIIILSKTIQELVHPHKIISKMLLKGKTAVISFVNYGYWLNRISFLVKGRRPMNEVFPFNWYDSSDLRPLSIKDFEDYCKKQKIIVLKKVYLKGDWMRVNRFLPNLFAGYALYHLTKEKKTN